MADTVEFELVSPEKLLLSEPVEMVVVPGSEGDFGVLPGHAPVISTVRPGVIATYEGGKVVKRIFIAGGFAEVTQERCTVLAEEAIPLDTIDRAAADARLKAATEAVTDARDEAGKAEAEAKVFVAQELLKAVEAPTAH